MTTTPTWVSTQEMAARLNISTRTLFTYQKRGDLFQQGRHFRRSTPSAASAWLWDPELTEKTWLAETGKQVKA